MSIKNVIGGVLTLAVAAGMIAADARPDVSQIVTKVDADAILGEPVREPSPRSGEGTDGYYSKCNYYGGKGGKSLIIRLQLPGPNAIPPTKQLELLTAANGGSQTVAGLGDFAQMSTAGGETGFESRVLMLYVVKGNAFLTVGISGFADDSVAFEKAKTVAQKILEHL